MVQILEPLRLWRTTESRLWRSQNASSQDDRNDENSNRRDLGWNPQADCEAAAASNESDEEDVAKEKPNDEPEPEPERGYWYLVVKNFLPM